MLPNLSLEADAAVPTVFAQNEENSVKKSSVEYQKLMKSI